MLYEVWEKKTVYLVPASSPGYPAHPIAPGGPPPGIWPDPGYPAHPIAPGGPPPGIWPGPGYPAHPIAPGGPPPSIWPGPGYPAHPIAPGGPPPGIWPGPGYPAHPIVIPPSPPVYQPLPPEMVPPSSPPTGVPDLASPGFYCYVVEEGKTSTGWIQTALDQSPEHKPRPPEKGLPGKWLAVYSGTQADYAWLPSEAAPPSVQPVRK
jgi:hypothetical protein